MRTIPDGNIERLVRDVRGRKRGGHLMRFAYILAATIVAGTGCGDHGSRDQAPTVEELRGSYDVTIQKSVQVNGSVALSVATAGGDGNQLLGHPSDHRIVERIRHVRLRDASSHRWRREAIRRTISPRVRAESRGVPLCDDGGRDDRRRPRRFRHDVERDRGGCDRGGGRRDRSTLRTRPGDLPDWSLRAAN